MSFQAQEYLDAAGSMPATHDEWTLGDRSELAEVLCVPSVIKAFSLILLEAQSLMDQFRGFDLSSPDGVSRATRTQGVVEGMETALQRLAELAEHERKGN